VVVGVGVGVVPSVDVGVDVGVTGIPEEVGVGVGVTGVPQQSMSVKPPEPPVDTWYGLSVTQTFTLEYPGTSKFSVPPEQYDTFQVLPLPKPPYMLYS
jgi:hypothetical protein